MMSFLQRTQSAAPDDARSTGRPGLLPSLFRTLRSKVLTILVIALPITTAVLIAWTFWPMKYTAVALVALDPQAPRLIADQATAANGDSSNVVSYAEIATSDGFLLQLANQLNLLTDPEFTGPDRNSGDALLELRRNLKVAKRGLSYLIDVSFSSKAPEKAALIANAVAEEIVHRQQVLRQAANSGISEALRSSLDEQRATLLASEKAVADYRQQNRLLDVSSDGRVGLKRLNSLTDQLGPLRSRLEDSRARLDQLRKAKMDENADPSVFRSSRLSDLLARLGDERWQMAPLAQTYGPRHPSVVAAQSRISALETAIRTERSRVIEQVSAEVNVLTEQNAAYEKEIAKRTDEVLAADQKEVVLQDLVRQAQANRQIYEQFLARQKTAQAQSDLSQPEAVVISSAIPPTRSSKLGFTTTAIIGLVGGLGLGILWALFGSRPPPAPLTGVAVRSLRRVLGHSRPASPTIPPGPADGPPSPKDTPNSEQPSITELRRSLNTQIPDPPSNEALSMLYRHDVPLVADLTMSDPEASNTLLNALAKTLCPLLESTPGMVLTVAGETSVPVALVVALASAVESHGYAVAIHDGLGLEELRMHYDLIVEPLVTPDAAPPLGTYPVALLAVEATTEPNDRLSEALRVWLSDPDRLVMAAFVPHAAAA